MRHLKLRFVIIALLTFIIGVAATIDLSKVSPHFWRKMSGAKVSYNELPYTSADIYRSHDGSLLIDLRDFQDRLYELHYFEDGKLWLVGPTNLTNFYFLLPGYAYSRNIPPPTVDMNGPKISIDPQIIVKQNYAEFTSAENKRVRIAW